MLDTNGDDLVTLMEIYNIAKKEVRKLGSSVERGDVTTMGKLFKLVDTDNNGFIDKEEWGVAVENAFDDVDADDNEKINFCELAEAFNDYKTGKWVK